MSKGANEYLFDVQLLAAIRVRADNLEEARDKMMKAIDCADSNFGAWPETGNPITGEASVSFGKGGPLMDCAEIDGEPPCDSCGERVDLDGYDGKCGNCADAIENAETDHA